VGKACVRLTMFLYSSNASSSVVSAPTLLSMISPYWLRHRYVDMAPLDLDGRRNSRVFVNSLFSAPGKSTLISRQSCITVTTKRTHTSQHSQSKQHLGTAVVLSQSAKQCMT
jgi:hypothetical protein